MTLPFLKLKQEGSSSEPVETAHRKPDEMPYDMLDAVVEDMLRSFHSQNKDMLKSASFAGEKWVIYYS